MNKTACETTIRVQQLSKHYRIGRNGMAHDSLKSALSTGLGALFNRGPNVPQEADRRSFWALRNVSLEVKRGEVLGIVGRNGAGKSTLLKILARITDPTSGRAELFGRAAALLEVGTGFEPELTGRENIYLNGAILGMRRVEIDRKFDEIVDFAGIGRFLDTPVKRYSSGMYVRLGFAIAAHLDPDILFVDEVLAVGDLEFQEKCLGKMKAVSNAGRTVVFVSHSMANIAMLCSKVLWLERGEAKALGMPRDVLAQYVGMGDAADGAAVWHDPAAAPGGEVVQLQSVRILSGGRTTSNVLIDEEVTIQIVYWNKKPGAVLDVSVHLRDKTNGFVFANANRPSSSLTRDEWTGKPRPQGLYRTTCTIPANFLNDERYSIDVGVSNNRHQWEVKVENVVAFRVHDTGEMKKEYRGAWVGVIRPKLAWSTQAISEHDPSLATTTVGSDIQIA